MQSQYDLLRIHTERIKTLLNPELLLISLGFEIWSQNQREIRCACVIHKGDGKTSFRYKRETNTFLCFSHYCHEIKGKDVVSLVRVVLNCSYREAIEYLSEFVGLPFDLDSIKREDIDAYNNKAFLSRINRQKEFVKSLAISDNQVKIREEDIKSMVKNRSRYFSNRGFLDTTLDLFEVGTSRRFVDGSRETIPIRDDTGVFVGMSARLGRDLEEYTDIPKYSIVKDFKKFNYLYGLDKAKSSIKEFNDTLIVVEGFTDVWALWEAGISSCVATMGVGVSNVQRYLISKYANKCIVFYDGDDSGIKATPRVVNFMKGFVKAVPFYPEKGMEPSKYDRSRLLELVGGLI